MTTPNPFHNHPAFEGIPEENYLIHLNEDQAHEVFRDTAQRAAQLLALLLHSTSDSTEDDTINTSLLAMEMTNFAYSETMLSEGWRERLIDIWDTLPLLFRGFSQPNLGDFDRSIIDEALIWNHFSRSAIDAF